MTVDTDELREDLRFDALNSALYHTDRRGFYELADGLTNIVVLVGSSGSVLAFGASHPLLGSMTGFVVTVCGALSLVFSPSRKACHEAVLCSRAYGVLAEAEGAKSTEELRAVRGKLNLIYGDELPTMRAVNAIAFNAAQESLFPEGKRKRVRIHWLRSLFRHIIPFHGADFPPIVNNGDAVSVSPQADRNPA